MDYPFFIEPICTIPLDVIEALAACAVRQAYGTHPHFYKTQKVTAYIGSQDYSCELGKLVRELVLPLIPMDAKTATMWEVNRLDAGDSITEHSDIAAQSGAQAVPVMKSHKIHIPLVTSEHCIFTHRRSIKQDQTSVTMPVGKAYAYNNYVWHAVHNNSDKARYQMTIRYWDPEWNQKTRILESLRVPNGQSYERF